MSDEVFGPVTTLDDVEMAVVTTLRAEMPRYLRFFERKKELKPMDYPNVRSWRAADTMEDRFPEQQIPAAQVMLTTDGTVETEAESASLLTAGPIDILVAGNEPEVARKTAHVYALAAAMALVQHQNLDGSIELGGQIHIGKIGVPAVGKPRGGRWLALGSFEVGLYVLGLFDPTRGPANAPTPGEDDGTEIPPDWPTVATTHIDLIPED